MDAFQLIGALSSMSIGGALPRITIYDINLGFNAWATTPVGTHAIYITQLELAYGGSDPQIQYRIVGCTGIEWGTSDASYLWYMQYSSSYVYQNSTNSVSFQFLPGEFKAKAPIPTSDATAKLSHGLIGVG